MKVVWQSFYNHTMNTKKRVLVVDDEAGILNFVRINLKIAGYEVITTASGEEALELVKSHNPDIMLLDILMQPLTGFDVLERLRTFSKIPVIVFTARSDIAEEALKKGANGYLPKPFLPEELVKRTRSILEAQVSKN